MNEICRACKLKVHRINPEPVLPDIKKGSNMLMLLDFPVVEDTEGGIILSGITHRRARFIHSIMRDAKIDDSKVSYASAIRCITKSKSIISISDYELCSRHLFGELEGTDIKTVVCFGSIPGSIMTGKMISSIDSVRGALGESVIPGIDTIITYSLSIAIDGTGCRSCNPSSLYPSLVLKDVTTAARELRRRKIW